MKSKTLIVLYTAVSTGFAPGLIHAQQALKTDLAGNPVTLLNLGGGNVTGTLPAARLPAGIGAPGVQTITQAQGEVALASGTNVAVLAAPLTGPLNLRLPAASSYPAGRVLVVVDPGGYSSTDQPVSVLPSGTDSCNGSGSGAGPTPVLTGTGAASLYPDGPSGWSAGQSYLRAPSTAGLALAGPAVTSDGNILSVDDGAGRQLFYVRGDGTSGGLYFDAATALSSDGELIYSDGNGGLNTDTLTASTTTSTFLDLPFADPTAAITVDNSARLYYGTDGALHVRTSDHVDHILTWTTAP